jgi:prepilin-type N-terminal cleavage/methylation domain-containing protein
MRLPRIATDERGFSLLELLVALLILAFVALGIASLFSHAQLTNASGYDYALLASEARRSLEDLLATPFNDAALIDTAGTPRQLTTARRGFDIRYTVQDFQVLTWNQLTSPPWPTPATAAEANLKQITLRVNSTTRILTGRREFVVSAIKIAG